MLLQRISFFSLFCSLANANATSVFPTINLPPVHITAAIPPLQSCKLDALAPLQANITVDFPLGAKAQIGCLPGYTTVYTTYQGVSNGVVECTEASHKFDASNYASCSPKSCMVLAAKVPQSNGDCPPTLKHSEECSMGCIAGTTVSPVGISTVAKCLHGSLSVPVFDCDSPPPTPKPTANPTNLPSVMPTSTLPPSTSSASSSLPPSSSPPPPPTSSPLSPAVLTPSPSPSPTAVAATKQYDVTCTASLTGLQASGDMSALLLHFSTVLGVKVQQLRLFPVPSLTTASSNVPTAAPNGVKVDIEIHILNVQADLTSAFALCSPALLARAVTNYAAASSLPLTVVQTGHARITQSESCTLPRIDGANWAVPRSAPNEPQRLTKHRCSLGSVLLPEEACDLVPQAGQQCSAHGVSLCLVSGQMSIAGSVCGTTRYPISLVSGILFLLMSPFVCRQAWLVVALRRRSERVSNQLVAQHCLLVVVTISYLLSGFLQSKYLSSEWSLPTGWAYFLSLVSGTALFCSVSLLIFVWVTVIKMPSEQTARPLKLFVLANCLMLLINIAFSVWALNSSNQLTPRKVDSFFKLVCNVLLSAATFVIGKRLYSTLKDVHKKGGSANLPTVARRIAIATGTLICYLLFTCTYNAVKEFLDPYAVADLEQWATLSNVVPVVLVYFLQSETVNRLEKKVLSINRDKNNSIMSSLLFRKSSFEGRKSWLPFSSTFSQDSKRSSSSAKRSSASAHSMSPRDSAGAIELADS
mmetsp:Transcript_29853/g.58485  ORF Transcript_29853/g.58485 Transcript_29853/m.58485 type:complete len:756 (-) Transcript_29853:121-2388(-)